jgi:two-component sensor histidine kinase
MVTSLKVLSTANSLAVGNLPDFYQRARASFDGTGVHLILLDSDMNQLFNTRVPYGEPLSKTSDPDGVRAAMTTGKPVISNLFFGQTSKKWVFNVLYPLPGHMEDGARVLAGTQNAESLSDTLVQQSLRGGWNVTLVDQRNMVIASTYMSNEIGKPFFLASASQSGTRKLTAERDSQSYYAVSKVSDMSGWRSVVWAPSRNVEAPLRNSMQTLILGGLAVIGLSALGALTIGRQIARAIRGLARDAQKLGQGEAVAASPYPIREIATVSEALADASRNHAKAERDIRLLMREVAHRSKNQLTVVSSLAKQSARNARSFEAFHDSFQKRLHGLARSTDLLIAGGAAGVELRALLTAQIEPFAPGMPDRVEMTGPIFLLANHAAQTIGLAVHEMATNAAKYGAFAVPLGRLAIRWRRDGDVLHLDWRENVPRLRKRQETRGFGTEVIERMLQGTLDAEIVRTLHPDGIQYHFRIPLVRVEPEKVPAAPDQPFE